MPGLPFVGSLYDYSHGPGSNISQLLLEQGRARAASADRIGQIWQNTISNLGKIPGEAREERLRELQITEQAKERQSRQAELDAQTKEREQRTQREAAQAEKEAALSAKLDSGQPLESGDFYKALGMKGGFDAYKAYKELQNPQPDLKTVAVGFDALSPGEKAKRWLAVSAKMAQAHGSDPSVIPSEFDQGWLDKLMIGQGWKKEPEKSKPTEVAPGGYLVQDGKVVFHAPERPKDTGSSDDPAAVASTPFPMLDKKTGETRSAVRMKDGGIKWLDEVSPGMDAGPAPTTMERERHDQAGHVIDQAQSFLKDLKDKKTRDLFGGLSGYAAEVRQKPGLARALLPNPPEAGRAKGVMASLSAFLPRLHGMRGGENMIAHFEGVLGDFTSSPELVEQATTALLEAARRIQKQGDQADLSDLTADVSQPSGSGFRVVGVK